jgi:hypothetical protein
MVNLKLLFWSVLKIFQIGFIILIKNSIMRGTVLPNMCRSEKCMVDFQLANQFSLFNNIGLMQCSQTLSVISSTDWEKNRWSGETSPAFEFWARFAGSIFILPNTARS